MSELEGFEVLPTFNQRTNKGKIGYRDKRINELTGRIEQLESLLRGFHHCAQQGKCANCEHFRGNDGCGMSIWERYDALGLMEGDEDGQG